MLLPPPETTPSFTESLIFRDTQPLRGEIQQRLIGIGRRFADIRRAAAEKIERAAAVRRAIGVAHHHGGDVLEACVQLFGHNLPVGRERGALAEIALAGANQDGVVGMNLNPGAGERRVERVLRARGLDGFLRTAAPTIPKPTNRAPPVFTNWRRVRVAPKTLTGFSLMVAIALAPLRHDHPARCTASMMAV